MSRVLLIQPDGRLAKSLSLALGRYGHSLRWRPNGLSGLKSVIDDPPEVVLLDLALPDLDADKLVAMLRAVSNVPVIALVPQDGHLGLAGVLDRGADDFVVKPCAPDHLDSKIRDVLQQDPAPPLEGPVTVGDLRIDPRARTVTLAGTEVSLSRLEFDLLHLLARSRGRPLSRHELNHALWPPGAEQGRSLEATLWTLRHKLGESGTHPHYLHTIRRVGVVLRNPDRPLP